MASNPKPLLLDETYLAQQSAENALLASISKSLNAMAKTQGTTAAEMDYDTIRAQIKLGQAPTLFPVGTQLVNTYTDKDGKSYSCPWDVVKNDDTAEGQSGTTAPALIMQMHYATLYDVPFSDFQAFYIVPEGGMVAGTYHVTMGFDWGDNVKNGESWQFTTSKALPKGALLCGFHYAPHSDIASLKVYAYKDQYKSELLDTCTLSKGNTGIDLGTFLAGKNGSLNSLHPVAWGDNRWWKSACRQYLNSDAGPGKWWTPQDEWDMMPDCAKTLPGFLAGFSEEFRNALTPVKVVTYGNNVTDDGRAATTYDKVFLPCLEELYCSAPSYIVGEGTYWPYWKERTGASVPQAVFQTYPLRITRGLAQTTVGQAVRLRSADRLNVGGAFDISSSGTVSYLPGADTTQVSPACKLTILG